MLTIALLMMLQQAPAVPAPAPAPAKPAAPAQPVAPAPPAPSAPAPPAPVMQPEYELLQIKTVYLMPMGNAFDQYLANHLTRGAVLQVVTDPARADAVFTDRLGKSFQLKMEELYPTPKPEPEVKKKDDEDSDKQTMDVKSAPMERTSSFGRGKSTYFLVHRGSRNVVWSIYEKPKSMQSDDLDDTAKYVSKRLETSIRDTAKAARGK